MINVSNYLSQVSKIFKSIVGRIGEVAVREGNHRTKGRDKAADRKQDKTTQFAQIEHDEEQEIGSVVVADAACQCQKMAFLFN